VCLETDKLWIDVALALKGPLRYLVIIKINLINIIDSCCICAATPV